jgi:hypothetical protein
MEQNELNENVVETNDAQVNDSEYLINTIKELKANTVSKEKYDRLVAENKGLADALKTGQQITLVEPEKEVDIDELRAELYGGSRSKTMPNIEYVEKTLQLRKALIERGEPDPFMPNGHDYQYDQRDQETANLIADTLQQCLDRAQGDNNVFTAEFLRNMKDDTPLKNLRGRK